MSLRRLTVFLSSTGKDLYEYRRAIIDHMRPLDGFVCDAMEEFGARDVSALPFCRERVRGADVLVGLIGNYRGWEPPGDNHQRSITELEYTWAGEVGRSRLMYVAPDDTPVPAHLTMSEDAAARQQAFRAAVLSQDLHDERFYRSHFSRPADLAAAVMAALANVQYRQMLMLIQQAASEPGASPPVEPSSAAGPMKALADFAAEPELAPVLADAERFDVSELEAAALARAEKLESEGRAMARNAAEQRSAAAAEYKRLAELTGLYDVTKALRYLEKATEADPADVSAWLKLGQRYAAAGRSDSALDAVLTASARARETGNEHAIYVAHIAVGDVLVTKGNLRDALERYHGALASSHKLADAAAPGIAARQHEISAAHSRIGEAQALQGDLHSALASFNASFDITERVVAADPANSDWQEGLAVAHNKIGEVLLTQGDLAAALDRFNASHAVFQSLAAAGPEDAKRQSDLAVSHDRLANVLEEKREFADALHHHEIARAIRRQLSEADPANAIWRRNLAISEIKVGDVHMELQDPACAGGHFEAASAIMRQVTDADPGHTAWQHDLGVAIERIGDLARAREDYPAALKSYHAKHDISASLVAADPANVQWRRDLAVAHGKLGRVLCDQGDLAPALDNLKTAIAIDEQLVKADPTNVGWQRTLAALHERIARVYQGLEDRDAERMSYQSALDIYEALLTRDPSDATTLASSVIPRWILGTATYPDGRAHLERAIAILEDLERRNRLDPKRRTWIAKIKSDLAEIYDD